MGVWTLPFSFLPLMVPLVLLGGGVELCLREPIFPADELLSRCSRAPRRTFPRKGPGFPV